MTTPWHLQPMAPFDSESTGLDVDNDRIVTACVGLIRPAAPRWDVQIQSWLIDPGVDIPEAATAVHGITTAYAKENGQPPAETLGLIAGEIALALKAYYPLVGANLAYDNTLLDRELRRYDLPTIPERIGRPLGPCIDVQVLDRFVDRYRKGGRKLTDLCATYGVRIDGAHDSTFDAMAAARVAFVIGQRAQMPADRLRGLYADRRNPDAIVRAFRQLADMTLADLHEAQIGWRAEQTDGLGRYWMSQAEELRHQIGKAADAGDDDARAQAEQDLADLEARLCSLDGSWPLRALAAAEIVGAS